MTYNDNNMLVANKLAHPAHEMSMVCNYFQVSPTNSRLVLVMRGGNKVSYLNTSNLITHLKKNHAELHVTFVQQSDETRQQPTPGGKKSTVVALRVN